MLVNTARLVLCVALGVARDCQVPTSQNPKHRKALPPNVLKLFELFEDIAGRKEERTTSSASDISVGHISINTQDT